MALFSRVTLTTAARNPLNTLVPQKLAFLYNFNRWFTEEQAEKTPPPPESTGHVLVTGANGYIASHVVRQLLQSGYKVRGTVRCLTHENKIQPLKDIGKYGNLELVEADLLDPDSWIPAARGCKYVQHMASYVPSFGDRLLDDDQLTLKPAVEGTLNVLNACKAARTVKRVVLTSSCLAMMGNRHLPTDKIFTEADWANPASDIDPYAKGKTLAEKAAWDFVAKLSGEEKFELAVINPSLAIGPAICGSPGASMNLFRQLLERKFDKVPPVKIPTVDVRDVARAHVAAMISPNAAGKRHLVTTDSLWLKDIGKILAAEFKDQGYNPPTDETKYWELWLTGLTDRQIRSILPRANKELRLDNGRFTQVLKIKPYPVEKSIVDTAYSLIEGGLVEKKSGFKRQENTEEFK